MSNIRMYNKYYIVFKPRAKRDEIQKFYVQCTKLDVAMNGMLVRAKYLDQTKITSIV